MLALFVYTLRFERKPEPLLFFHSRSGFLAQQRPRAGGGSGADVSGVVAVRRAGHRRRLLLRILAAAGQFFFQWERKTKKHLVVAPKSMSLHAKPAQGGAVSSAQFSALVSQTPSGSRSVNRDTDDFSVLPPQADLAKKIASAGHPFERLPVSRETAQYMFDYNRFKLEMLQNVPAGEVREIRRILFFPTLSILSAA